MRIGYARVSTVDQDNAMQISALLTARCDKIVQEKKSAVKVRPVLDAMLSELKRGDVLVVYKLDRLARSLTHLLQIVELVNKRGAHLKSVTEPVDHTTPAGRMFLQFLGAIAEFERALIRERSMAGQLEAMRAGKLFGRRSRLSLEVQNELVQLVGSGISLRDIGDAYGVSYTRVWTLHREATGRPYRNLGPVRALLYANK